jgi:hypothetical protein
MSPHEPYPLTNAHCKADWAKDHFDQLTRAVDDFCVNSHTVITEDEPERDQVRYRVHFNQPHVSIFLICGDYLQCLRTALDQAVWSLINHRTGADSEVSEFPVFAEPLNASTTRKFSQKTAGLSGPAIEYIKSIQPYNCPSDTSLANDPLWRIHQLNRFDKHRRISVQPQISFAGRHHFGMTGPGKDFALMSSERTDYGMDVVCGGSYKRHQPEISTFILFGDKQAGIFVNMDDLKQLHEFVADEVLVALASRA